MMSMGAGIRWQPQLWMVYSEAKLCFLDYLQALKWIWWCISPFNETFTLLLLLLVSNLYFVTLSEVMKNNKCFGLGVSGKSIVRCTCHPLKHCIHFSVNESQHSTGDKTCINVLINCVPNPLHASRPAKCGEINRVWTDKRNFAAKVSSNHTQRYSQWILLNIKLGKLFK